MPVRRLGSTVREVNRLVGIAPIIASFALLATLAGPADARPATAKGSPAAAPRIAAPAGGQAALLIKQRYPLDLSGRKVTGLVVVRFPGGGKLRRRWTARLHAGNPRPADRRAGFVFVHAVPVGKAASRRMLRNSAALRYSSSVTFQRPSARSDKDRGGGRSIAGRGLERAPKGMCSTAPLLLLRSAAGATAKASVPRCGANLRWSVGRGPAGGTASVRGGLLRFSQAKGASGADRIELVGRSRGKVVARRTVQLRVGPEAADSVSVRAMGDSVTAGFGYFGATGKWMPFVDLLDCKPAAVTYNDACSSNAYNRNSGVGTKPDYLPDFGLSRNISWAAQWANQYGITDFKNYAVSGSAPSDWLPGGQFAATTQLIQQDDPDYVVMTMGANPILSNVLFGIDDMGCALESDLFGDFTECVTQAFDAVGLSQNLESLYRQLVENTSARIVVMQYHLAVPAADIAYSAGQIAMMDQLMNQTIATVAQQVSAQRISVIAPPHFNVGIDMTPLYPADYSCSWLGWKVDGPSVQATPSQDLLEAAHPLSFCSGPSVGQPWIISGDSGIHPSAAGYAQMESRIPAPE